MRILQLLKSSSPTTLYRPIYISNSTRRNISITIVRIRSMIQIMVKYQNWMLYFLHREVMMIGWRWKNVCQSALLQGLQGRLLSLLEDYIYIAGDTRATSLITHVHRFNRDVEGSDTDWNFQLNNDTMNGRLDDRLDDCRYPNWVLCRVFWCSRMHISDQSHLLQLNEEGVDWRDFVWGYQRTKTQSALVKAISRERTSRASRHIMVRAQEIEDLENVASSRKWSIWGEEENEEVQRQVSCAIQVF